MKLLSGIALFLVLLSPLQWVNADSDNMDILRQKVAADKKLFIANNMNLSESEATNFWPVYEDFQKRLDVINGRLMILIDRYAGEFNAGTLTDDIAADLTKEMLDIEQAEVDLKKTFVPKLEKVLSKIKVARYLQLENKIRALLKIDMARKIPLVQ